MVTITRRTMNNHVSSRSLFLSVATVLTLMCSFTYISTGLLKAFISMGNTMIDTPYVHSLITSDGVPSYFRTMRYTSRRLLLAELCTKSDISIFQGEVNPLPSGIPTFSVQIMNLCPVGCSVSNIHVACGWFASAKLISPLVFRRVSFNDCLVNDGNPLDGGDVLSFEYSNSFEYPMRVEAAVICNRS